MGKLHTRRKRYMPDIKGRGGRKKRPKSFKTEESAKAWAEKKGIKNFTLKNLKNAECKEKKLLIIKK
jgi:hypothetical protein